MEQKKTTWIDYLGAFLYSSILTIPLVIYASYLFFRVKIKKSKNKLMSATIWAIMETIFVGAPFDIVFYILLFLPISTLSLFICIFLDYIDPVSEGLPSIISTVKKAMVTFLGDDFKEYLDDDPIVE
jgi:hypothetical protein